MNPPPRKPYARPVLKRYGKIESITAGQSGPFADGNSGMFRADMITMMGMA